MLIIKIIGALHKSFAALCQMMLDCSLPYIFIFKLFRLSSYNPIPYFIRVVLNVESWAKRFRLFRVRLMMVSWSGSESAELEKFNSIYPSNLVIEWPSSTLFQFAVAVIFSLAFLGSNRHAVCIAHKNVSFLAFIGTYNILVEWTEKSLKLVPTTIEQVTTTNQHERVELMFR